MGIIYSHYHRRFLALFSQCVPQEPAEIYITSYLVPASVIVEETLAQTLFLIKQKYWTNALDLDEAICLCRLYFFLIKFVKNCDR